MDKLKPKILIIILNYCNYTDTKKCVESIKLSDYDNFKVLIVDNDSPNDSIEQLNDLQSEKIHIISSGRNGGFAYGNNVGIDYAIINNFDYVILLNNDTTVEKDFLSKMVETYKKSINKNFVLTCRIMYGNEPDKVWYAGGLIDWENLRATHIEINKKFNLKSLKIENVQFASGCCMMIPINIINKIGKLPEEYFMYYEDLDYCVHLQELGYEIRYNPDIVIYHFVSSSSGGNNSPFVIEWSNRARRVFYKKYYFHIKKNKRFFIFLKCECKSILKIILSKHKFASIKAYLKSFKRVRN